MNMPSPMQWLIDRELLRQFPQRYARAVDQRDHDALAALFDPDGTVDGTFGQQADADAPLRTLGMRCVDDMIRRDGDWCIHHRVARMGWMR